MRKTKIICTLGLVSQTSEVIGELIDAGMNVARFNFSHGTHESHGKMLDILKQLRKEKDVPVAALLDTKGPEIRLGDFAEGRATLQAGETFTLTTDEVLGDSDKAWVSFSDLPKDVETGTRILLDDGLIELRVNNVTGNDIRCEIINGGDISNKKGVNVPGTELSMVYLSERDKSDIIFGIRQGFDFIAASFVQSAEDVLDIREILHENGGDNILIISKIENAKGVENIDEILRVSDGIMVARGDMGVEIDFELLPGIQKKLIKKAYQCGKMVVTATQMLESMVKNPRPTRAEATDVANAVYDGTSAIMLSGETAVGLYPVRAVKVMAGIAEHTEKDINYRARFENSRYDLENDNVTNAISHATCTTAYDLGASSIITVSMSGRAARNISKYRPDIPIIGCTPSEHTYRQLALSWGVVPALIQEEDDLDTLMEGTVKIAQDLGCVQNGDLVVISTGIPLKISGMTNLLKVHIAGNILTKGVGVGNAVAYGRIQVIEDFEEIGLRFTDGDILVVKETSNEFMSIIRKASGIIAERPGTNSHAAIVGAALNIPVIVGAKGACKILKSGTFVSIDAEHGFVHGVRGIPRKDGKKDSEKDGGKDIDARR